MSDYFTEYVDIMNEYEFIIEAFDDQLYNIAVSYESGIIDDSEYDMLYDLAIEATQEEIDKWLKHHKYDSKTKTIDVGGNRRKVELFSDKPDSVGYDSKAYDAVKKMSTERKAKLPKVNDIMYGNAAVGAKVRKEGISINKDTLRDTPIKNIENSLQHEGGHIKDLSNIRKLNRLPSVFAKYNYNDIPKEYRSKFLAMKKDIKAEKLDKDSSDVKSFMAKVERAVAASKKDKDYKLKYAYDKLNEDLDKRVNSNKNDTIIGKMLSSARNNKLNDHDVKPDERRADIIAGANSKDPKSTKNTTGYQIYHNIDPYVRSEMKQQVGDKTYDKAMNTKTGKAVMNAISGIAKATSKSTNKQRAVEQLRYGGSNISNVIAGKDTKKEKK